MIPAGDLRIKNAGAGKRPSSFRGRSRVSLATGSGGAEHVCSLSGVTAALFFRRQQNQLHSSTLYKTPESLWIPSVTALQDVYSFQVVEADVTRCN